MVVQYLVVSSGTQTLNQAMLTSLGTADWILVQVVQPPESPGGYTYIFRK